MFAALRLLPPTLCAVTLLIGITACDSLPRSSKAAPTSTVTVVVEQPDEPAATTAAGAAATNTTPPQAAVGTPATQTTTTANPQLAGLPLMTFNEVEGYHLAEPGQGWPESAPARCPYVVTTEIAYRDSSKNLTGIEQNGRIIQLFINGPANVLGKIRSDASHQEIMAAFPNAEFSDTNQLWGGLNYEIIDPATGHSITITQLDGKTYTGLAVKAYWSGVLGEHCRFPGE